MKILKRLITGLVVVAVLLAAGLFLALKFIDLNQYKDKIQEVAKQQTGRELTISGDIGVSYFPWVGLSLGELSMANSESFGSDDFVRMGGADVKIKLLPLLKKAVEVKTVTLNGLHIDLQRAADGTTNWQDLITGTESAESPAEPEATPAEESSVEAGSALSALAVSGIEITDASIRWTDAQAGTDATLNNFNLTTGAISPGEPFDFNTDFSVLSNSSGIGAKLNGEGEVTFDLEQQRYTVNQFRLNADAEGDALPNGSAAVELGANVVADLTGGTVDVEALTVTALGIALNGEIAVTGLNGEPAVSASLESDAFNPQQVLAELGVAAIETSDESVLQTGRISAALQASATRAELSAIRIAIDDTTLAGSASLPDLSAAVPPLRFELAVDAIDIDRYLPEVAADTADAPQSESTAGATTTADQPLDLPLELIRQLDVEGVFRIEDIKAANIRAKAISLPVVAKDGVVRANGIAASLYDGSVQADLGLDARGDAPAFEAGYQLDSVQAALLLADLLQDDPPVSGQANVQMNVKTSGETVSGLTAALAGDFNADFTDGSLNGINIGYQLRRAKSFLSADDEPVEQAVVKTDFSALHLGATIENGIISSNDLDIRSPGLRIGGDGSVDLPQEQVNYTVKSKVVGSVEVQGGADLDELKGLAINIPIRGSFAELAADFTGTIFSAMKDDFKNQAADNARALAEIEAEKLKAEARAKAKAAEQQAREKLEAEKARAEEKLAAELAKQEDKAKVKADELKEKAREKLKDLLK